MSFSIVSSAGGWGDIGSGDEDLDSIPVDIPEAANEDDESVSNEIPNDGFAEIISNNKYTRDFYIALGVGVIGVLIISIFAYFFIKIPKNKWGKKGIKKKHTKKKKFKK